MKSKFMIRNFSVQGLGGFYEKIDVDLIPSKSREFLENVEFWGLERNKYDFAALKHHIFFGENGAGKSSLMESIYLYFMFLGNHPMFQLTLLDNINYDLIEPKVNMNVEFVIKAGSKIVKAKHSIKFSVPLGGRSVYIEEEELKYIYTKTGQTVTKYKTLFTTKNNSIRYNGKEMFVQNSSSIKALYQLKQQSKPIEATIIETILASTTAVINREEKDIFDKQVLRLTPAFKKMSPKKYKFIIKLYQLFDHRILDITWEANQVFFKYKTSNGIKELPFQSVLARQSTGERRAFEIIDKIYFAREGAINSIFFDELDKSLHEKLVNALISIITLSDSGQIFITSHNPRIADKIFRNDQIHIIEKDKNNVIKFSDIIETKNMKFSPSYLKNSFLSNPTKKILQEIFDLLDD